MRVHYFQYTAPQNYPPLWRSARLFKRQGWDVRFYAPRWVDAEELRVFSEECGADVRVLGAGGSSADKVGYLSYIAEALRCIAREKPDWIYLSDIYAAPIAFLCPKRTRALYHEHDRFSVQRSSVWMRFLDGARRKACLAVDRVIVPNESRLEYLRQETGIGAERGLCVWNCPLREEVAPARSVRSAGPLRLVYSGTIVPDRLPVLLPQSMPEDSGLSIIGYETVGHPGYVNELIERARSAGRGRSVIWEGPRMSRPAILTRLREADVGLALVPMRTQDTNLQWMVGASNKPFEYLACGVLPLVSDTPAWREVFVEPGYALPCRADDPESLRQMLQWAADNPREVADRAESGRQRILSDWNYEKVFSPVLEYLSGGRPA